MKTKINMLKKDFPFFTRANLKEIRYLDSASTTQKPQQVLDAIQKAYIQFNANPGRGLYHLAEEATRHYEDARKTVARFIGAQPDEVVFTRGATEGINGIAIGWARNHLQEGDEIVLTELEHHSNILPWLRVAQETGAKVKYIPVLPNGTLDMNSLGAIITAQTKLVATTHSSNAIGTFVDLQPIIMRAHDVGARVLIDACQSVPHMSINVAQMNCDFLVFSGHKMLGPTGIGVLYMSERVQDEVLPWALGGGMVFDVSWHKYTVAKAPHEFEAGTPPFIQAMGLAAAITYLQNNVSFDTLQKHEAALCAQLLDGLSRMKSIHVVGPADELRQQGHLITFVVDGIHAHDVAAYLDQYGICVRAGHFCAQPLLRKLGHSAAIRASFYGYTDERDVDRLLSALQKM